MDNFFKDMGENPHQYGFNELNEDWDFEAREASYDSATQGLEYKSHATLNLRKQNPK